MTESDIWYVKIAKVWEMDDGSVFDDTTKAVFLDRQEAFSFVRSELLSGKGIASVQLYSALDAELFE